MPKQQPKAITATVKDSEYYFILRFCHALTDAREIPSLSLATAWLLSKTGFHRRRFCILSSKLHLHHCNRIDLSAPPRPIKRGQETMADVVHRRERPTALPISSARNVTFVEGPPMKALKAMLKYESRRVSRSTLDLPNLGR